MQELLKPRMELHCLKVEGGVAFGKEGRMVMVCTVHRICVILNYTPCNQGIISSPQARSLAWQMRCYLPPPSFLCIAAAAAELDFRCGERRERERDIRAIINAWPTD